MSTLIVSGLARCGSSLTMQMLACGGLVCAGRFPAYEDARATRMLPVYWAWLREFQAVKILDPREYLPELSGLAAVWLDRDPVEQSKSWAKYQRRVLGMHVNRQQERSQRAWLKQERPKALRWVRRVCDGRVLVTSFELMLSEPQIMADALASFASKHTGAELDAQAMARAVERRGPKCLPGFLEAEQLRRRNAQVG